MRREPGKKIAEITVTTPLGSYDLVVRFNKESGEFSTRVPTNPGPATGSESPSERQKFTAMTLPELREKTKKFLGERDTTTWSDVIEYELAAGTKWHEEALDFKFRIARVSDRKNKHGKPLLEVPVELNDDGQVVVQRHFNDEERQQENYHPIGGDSSSMPYSSARWRACSAIKEALDNVRTSLKVLVGDDAEERFEALGASLAPGGLTTTGLGAILALSPATDNDQDDPAPEAASCREEAP